MKIKYFSLLIFSLVLASLVSACTGNAFVPSGLNGVSADQKTAYVTNNTAVTAINLADGTEKWLYPPKAEKDKSFFMAPVLTTDGQLIVGGYNKILYSLNPDTGKENWSFSEAQNHYIASPLVTSQAIYAPNADNNLYAVDLKGKKLWTFTSKGPLWAQPAGNDNCKCLYLASMDHNVYALNQADGKVIWKRDLGAAMVGTPGLSQDGNTLYIGTFGNQMAALDSQTGQVIWQVPTKGWVWSGSTVDNDRLYFGDLNGNFYALNAKDGSALWAITPGGAVAGTPLVTKEAIYIPTDVGTLLAVDQNGKTLWSQTIGGKIYSPPVMAGDTILVTPQGASAVLVALNTNGTQKWVYPLPKK